MKKVLFQEKRRFPPQLTAIIYISVIVIMAFSLWIVQKDSPEELLLVLLIYLITLIPLSFLFFIGVEVKLEEDAFKYRVLPLSRSFKTLPKSQINLSYKKATKKKRIGHYGFKTAGNTKYFLIGDHNLHVEFGKKKFIFGTLKPQELQHIINNYWNN